MIGSPVQIEADPEPSSLERIGVKALGYVPGLKGMAASRRILTAMRGGAWTFAGYGASQLLRLASTLTLARMLVPQAFGLVALVNVFLSGLEMLSDLGIGMDVVQHPRGEDPVFINTAFIIQAGRAFIIWTIATALAYPFAKFYHQPAVVALAVVGATSVGLRGLASGSVWTLTRHVKLGKLTALNTGSDLFGFLVSVIWAIVSPTAWALVVGRVASTLAFTIASHLIAEYPVSLAWDAKAAKDIFAFGAGIFLSTSTYFLGGEAERLVVGKFVNLVELGCFSLALSISSAAGKGLQQVIPQVFFPMISHSIREDRDAAGRHFRKARRLVLVVSICLGVGFIVASHLFVAIVLGPKYEMAGWMLQLLGVRAALELFMSVTVSMLFALGTSRYAAIGNVVKLAFLALGLSVAFWRYGFTEALWVLTLAPIANYVPLVFGMNKRFKGLLRSEALSFACFVGSMVVTAFLVRFFLEPRGF